MERGVTMYVIKSTSGKYIGKRCIVSDINKAQRFDTISNASKCLLRLPIRIRRICSTWRLIDVQTAYSEECVPVKEENELLDFARSLLNTDDEVYYNVLMNKLSVYKNKYSKLLAYYDIQIVDILHKLEQGKFNACEGYKFSKLLSDIYKKRRIVKNYFSFINNDALDFTNKKRIVQALNNRQYTPRILNNLF